MAVNNNNANPIIDGKLPLQKLPTGTSPERWAQRSDISKAALNALSQTVQDEYAHLTCKDVTEEARSLNQGACAVNSQPPTRPRTARGLVNNVNPWSNVTYIENPVKSSPQQTGDFDPPTKVPKVGPGVGDLIIEELNVVDHTTTITISFGT